jgi:uncharacterized protein
MAAYFDLEGGLKLALWPRESIARDTGFSVTSPGRTEFAIGHDVSSRAEVDVVLDEAEKAGGIVVTRGRDTFWGGYAGCFQDLDGHLWEVAWNPQWTLPG